MINMKIKDFSEARSVHIEKKIKKTTFPGATKFVHQGKKKGAKRNDEH